MPILPVKQGISAPAVTNIPEKWDRQWFRLFINNFLVNADIRNATGTGITISGNVSGNSTTGTGSTGVTISPSPIANNTVMGNVSGVTAVPTAISQAQLTAIVNLFTSTLSGAVPASGGGTVNFLRADGTWNIPSGSAAIPNNTVLGNVSGVSAAAVALTQAQLTALVNVFTSTLSGAAPASGGGTTNFLRADATWAVPPVSSGANPTASVGLSAVNGVATTFMRSDGAPALSQSITPTWTGAHTFSALVTANLGLTVTGAAFTSRGITDNATTNAITIANTQAITTTAPSSGSSLTVTGNNSGIAMIVASGLPGSTGGADIKVTRAGSTINQAAQGPNIFLNDTTNTTGHYIQESGGQLEIWASTGGGPTLTEQMVILTSGGVFSVRNGIPSFVLNSSGSNFGFIQNDSSNNWSLATGTTNTTLGTAVLKWNATGNVVIPAPSSGTAFAVTGLANNDTATLVAPNTANQSFGHRVQAGTSSTDYSIRIVNAANTTDYFKVRGDGETFVAPNGTLLFTLAALTNNSGAATGTLTNAPAAGNPTKWIKINDNGTVRSIPAW